VLDAASGKPVISSTYFDVLKSKYELVGSVAALEPIRANKYTDTSKASVLVSGYAKVMDDLIIRSDRDKTTITSRDDIALMGRFITTIAGFVSNDGALSMASMIPVESSLRLFAAGGLPGGLTGKTWSNSIGTTTTQMADAFWTEVKQTATIAPSTVSKVIKGTINSAQLSMDPVIAKANASSIDLTAVTGAYNNQGAGVLQPYRDTSKALTGFYHTTTTIPFVYIVPTGTAPGTGWPLVIFQHGINDHKERVTELAGPLTANGYAVIAIDLPLHGELAISGHPAAYWGLDFMSLAYPLAARTNFQQAAFNLHRLDLTLLGGGFAVLGADAPNRTTVKPKFVALSLGSFVGTYYLAGNTANGLYPTATDMKGFLSVPGGRLAYALQNSPTYSPPAIAGLASMGIVKDSPAYHSFWLVTQSIWDSVDPATMTTPLAATLPSRLSGRIAMQEAVGDQSIPNENARYFGNALGGREVLGAPGALVAPGFKQLGYNGSATPRIPVPFMGTLTSTGALAAKADFAASSATALAPTEGYFQFDQTGISHEFLLNPAGSATATKYAQDQMLYFLNNGIVVDPVVVPSLLTPL
jgi:hypothetical protein